jgi:hypothetical protein
MAVYAQMGPNPCHVVGGNRKLGNKRGHKEVFSTCNSTDARDKAVSEMRISGSVRENPGPTHNVRLMQQAET